MIEIKRRRTETANKAAQGALQAVDAQAMGETARNAENAAEREIRPFTGKRDYRAMYRAAFECHDRHNPPRIDREYWQTHALGADEAPQLEREYWQAAADDIGAVGTRFNNDAFMISLLSAVYGELQREYEAARRSAAHQPPECAEKTFIPAQ